MEDAPPIEELLPGVGEKDHRRVLKREINRLIPQVGWALDAIGIHTEADLQPNPEKPGGSDVVRTYDLIDDYFQLPRDHAHIRLEFSNLVICMLDQGLGALDECKRNAVRRAFSPISWLAWILRFFIVVLERAGVPMDDAASKSVQAVGWLLRLGTLAAVVFGATRLGLSVPWDKIIAAIK